MTSSDRPEPYRPALVTLTEDVRERVRELSTGLASERRALMWMQEMTIRTLGRIDTDVYRKLASEFRGDQGVLLGAMLRPQERRIELVQQRDDETEAERQQRENDVAQQIRNRYVANFVIPAHRDAFRRLRTDATEYVDEADGGDSHNPERQRFVAMRPAISELETWQERALELLLEGFDDRSELLEWGQDVILATHGELGKDWVTRVYEEESAVSVMTGDTAADARARRLFGAHHLLPHYRAGVRVLSGRAGELADIGQSDDTEPPDW